MSITQDEARKVAHLARIAVAEADLPRLADQLNGILHFMEQLNEVDVEGVEPMTGVTPMRLKRRRDEVTDGGIPDMDKAPSGEVELLGYARRGEMLPERPPLEGGPGEPTQVYGLNTDQVGDAMGLDLHADYVQLAEGQPGGLRPIPLPTLETGPYLAYGIQWIFFGLMAASGLKTDIAAMPIHIGRSSPSS